MSEKLGASARVIAVQLEQTRLIRGHELIGVVARELRRCETAVKSDVISGLTELCTYGYAEAVLPGARSKALACCAQPLDREYRLTKRGHDWKCGVNATFTGQVHRLRGH